MRPFSRLRYRVSANSRVPLHAVSPGCVWPARPPSCPPLQSHLHPTPQILRDPLGDGRPPCTPLPRRGERQPRDDLHFYENRASGATPRGAGAAPPGWLLGSAPRRSPALGARAPSPCARPPPPSRSHSLPGFDLCLTTVTSHGLQGSFVGSCKVLEPPEGCRRSSSEQQRPRAPARGSRS